MAKDPLLLELKRFLSPRLLPNKPLLLGYSGGPDSTALLHLLLDFQHITPIELHLAHLDHGWREESALEARSLEEAAAKRGLHFHLRSLKKEDFASGDLENRGREERFRFFSDIYQRIGAQALILGHHADDWAETVLKRLFEGASLPSLGGLKRQTQVEGMLVYRPLLSFSKKQILAWLSARNLSYLEDPTNQSSQFLRGRMRFAILPLLEQSFGKKVSANLCHLGEEAHELRAYFQQMNRSLLDQIDATGFLDVTPWLPLPSVQIKYLLREWIQREGGFLSRQMIQSVSDSILNGSYSQFRSSSISVVVKRGVVKINKI